jgi:hypothetical protein
MIKRESTMFIVEEITLSNLQKKKLDHAEMSVKSMNSNSILSSMRMHVFDQ